MTDWTEDEKKFPVLWQGDRAFIAKLKELDCPKLVPWNFVAVHAEQCEHNHSQSPTRLAERGGLDPREMVDVVGDRPYRYNVTIEDAVSELKELVRQYIVSHGKWHWWVRRMSTAHGVVIEDKHKPEWLKAEKLPDEGNLALLDQEVGRVTLRDFLDVLGRESKERTELAGILWDLNKAIDAMESCMHGTMDTSMTKLKNLRETFNRIPPKWFHA